MTTVPHGTTSAAHAGQLVLKEVTDTVLGGDGRDLRFITGGIEARAVADAEAQAWWKIVRARRPKKSTMPPLSATAQEWADRLKVARTDPALIAAALEELRNTAEYAAKSRIDWKCRYWSVAKMVGYLDQHSAGGWGRAAFASLNRREKSAVVRTILDGFVRQRLAVKVTGEGERGGDCAQYVYEPTA